MTFVFAVYWLALLISFFVVGCIIGAVFSPAVRRAFKELVVSVKRPRGPLSLSKHPRNPVMSPGRTPWEAEAVLNPAAVFLGGRTHLIYRAVGSDGVSRLGYASSPDGITFDDRLPYPVFAAPNPNAKFGGPRRYSPVLYPSGGSWGGCEDPRMVAVEGRVYITFNAFDNWSLRIGCISISEADFLAKKWRWSPSHFLSQPDGRDKNWMIFPEKINGKFAILHSIIGNDCDRVRIEYADDIDSYRPEKHKFYSPDPQRIPHMHCAWHDRVRSAGPPPIKTAHGWLVFYHATQADEGNSRYKLGAMLLDLDDPTLVLYRASYPVVEPDERYENDGKPGIVYACGAVVRDGVLYIYYGGGDKVVCVATTMLESFVNSLMTGEHVQLSSQQTQAA